MSFNLIDLVKDQLSEQVMGSIGSVIGGNSSQNDLAVNSAIPGLLGSLTDFGSSASDADLMFKGIEKQDDGILDNLGDLLGGSGQNGLIEGGTKMLGSLLGGGGLGNLVGSIAGFSGAGKSGTSKLLGLLAPIIFGVIKRKLMGGGGFDVSSLMGLLNGQKSNVAASMPSGFNLISATPEKIGNAVNSTVSDTVNSGVETTQKAAKSGGSLLGKLLPLAILVGAGLLAYNFFMKDKSAEVTSAPVVEEASIAEIQGNLVNFDKNVAGAVTSMTTSFGSITDVESAKLAIPSITESTDKLNSLGSMFGKLPDAAKGPITKVISEGTSKIQVIVDNLATIPGVGDIIAPAVEKLSSAFNLFR